MNAGSRLRRRPQSPQHRKRECEAGPIRLRANFGSETEEGRSAIVDDLRHGLDAFLRWPEAELGFSGPHRVHPPGRVSQEGELALRHLADSCLLLVDRQLQLAQEFAHPRQSPFGFPLPTQDHEVVSIGGCPGRIIAVVLMDFTLS
jgi:hypothetical protein